MWAVNRKAVGVGLKAMAVGDHIMTPHAPDARHRSTGFNVFPSGFALALVRTFLAILLFLPFEMGMFSLCHCTLEVCNLFWILQGLIAKSLPCFRKDFELELFNSVGTFKTRGTYGDGPNAFCFIRWT
jgi:hypothetical protein